VSWYDNEWGYSCRVADLLKFMLQKGIWSVHNRVLNCKRRPGNRSPFLLPHPWS